MVGRPTKILIFAAAILIATGLWFSNRLKAAQREHRYQTALTSYAANLKPGMNRERVEHYLQNHGTQYRQMCCVSERASLVEGGWDDLVKIGEETAPWICGKSNVYIAFEFNPKSPGELPDTNDSDTLKQVVVFHQVAGCL